MSGRLFFSFGDGIGHKGGAPMLSAEWLQVSLCRWVASCPLQGGGCGFVVCSGRLLPGGCCTGKFACCLNNGSSEHSCDEKGKDWLFLSTIYS